MERVRKRQAEGRFYQKKNCVTLAHSDDREQKALRLCQENNHCDKKTRVKIEQEVLDIQIGQKGVMVTDSYR